MTVVGDEGYAEKIACMFISMYLARNGEPPYDVLFNRFMTLVHGRIRESLGKDIGLPHCWYRRGDEVAYDDMPYISLDHEGQDIIRVSYSGYVLSPSHDDDDVIMFAGIEAGDFISRHHGKTGLETVADMECLDAPFQFQNKYERLRRAIRTVEKSGKLSDCTLPIRQLFIETMESFPHDEFPGMGSRIRGFGSIFNRALDKGLSADRLQGILEGFWFMFCCRLRLHPLCHENISAKTIGIWKEEMSESDEDYAAELERYAGYLIDEDESDPIIADLHEHWRQRSEAIEELLEAMHIDGE